MTDFIVKNCPMPQFPTPDWQLDRQASQAHQDQWCVDQRFRCVSGVANTIVIRLPGLLCLGKNDFGPFETFRGNAFPFKAPLV